MLRRALLALTLTLLAPLALAAYPDKPVRLIINNPAGGPVDAMARLLGERWGQPVIVENRPGASGMISVNALTKAAPDGYTLGLVVASTVTIVPFAVSNFDPVDALTPVSLVARTPFVFVVAADSPLRSWEDFVAASKARELNLGSFSIGTAFHLVWEQTARRAGIQALYAPSSSSGKTLNDLIGGQLDIALDAPSSAKGLLDSGRLRALAITSPQRFANLPDTPTLQEAGMDGYAAQPWIGLMGPAGLSGEQAAFIGDSVAEVLQEPAMRQQMQQLGMIPIGGDAQALRETIAAERAEMAPLVRELGIRLQ